MSPKSTIWTVLLLALAGGCTGKDGILTAHEVSGTAVDDVVTESGTGADDTDPTGSDSDSCVTGCATEQFPCVRDLAWNGGLLGMSSRDVELMCPSCDFNQVVLLTIDPVTAEQTLFAEGEVNSSGRQMAVAGDGSIFIAGTTDIPVDLNTVALLLKFSPDGELLWQKKPDLPPLVDLVLSGDAVVVVDGEHDLIAFSATDGAALWDIPNPLGYSQQVEQDAMGAFYVAGADTYPSGDALPSWTLRKYAADRTLLWEQLTPMTELDRPDSVGLALDEAGGAVVAVRNDPFDESPDVISFHKFTEDGAPVWSQPHPNIDADVETGDRVFDVIARPGGGVIVVGGLADGIGGVTFALDPDGEPLWQDLHQPDGLEFATNFAVTMAADALLVSGCGSSEGGGQVGWLFDPTP